jgi:hypothetical protein
MIGSAPKTAIDLPIGEGILLFLKARETPTVRLKL